MPFNPALLVIDLQYDFLPPDGSLAIQNGLDVLAPITSLLDPKHNWKTIITTQDWHPANHCSFATNHSDTKPFSVVKFTHPEDASKSMENMVWPVHCVQNTHGAEIHPEFLAELEKQGWNERVPVTNIRKGYLQDREYYSCFTDCWQLHHTELHAWLAKHEITDVVVVGLAYDFCVLHSAIDSAALGYRTWVLTDCCRGVAPAENKKTEELYREKNVRLIKGIPDGRLLELVKESV
ncbi:hypothetical protein BABINDRAFT_148176 [Babjeviella inositovora NRRL Y-12698]|uniref:nicotinamidase n=1 Tax=Babjeviella inositovora NRRL Y-12698 TaxID=984486 RepID=A0A1E3QN67_9ASCO|nr:uncharacterized protein BABINDRAFT_148176 [Babjeviella inositovora NRRL Y-12698]ODQ79123.1 hypothetical protein BABINDRAFT_148176 [Babjeviella inositovora NRRL Y-12698]